MTVYRGNAKPASVHHLALAAAASGASLGVAQLGLTGRLSSLWLSRRD
jgi:hypothetical protein